MGASSTIPKVGQEAATPGGRHRAPPGRKAEVHGHPSYSRPSTGKWPAPCPDLGDSRLPPEGWPALRTYPPRGRGLGGRGFRGGSSGQRGSPSSRRAPGAEEAGDSPGCAPLLLVPTSAWDPPELPEPLVAEPRLRSGADPGGARKARSGRRRLGGPQSGEQNPVWLPQAGWAPELRPQLGLGPETPARLTIRGPPLHPFPPWPPAWPFTWLPGRAREAAGGAEAPRAARAAAATGGREDAGSRGSHASVRVRS